VGAQRRDHQEFLAQRRAGAQPSDIDATLQGTLEIRRALLDTEQGQDFDFLGPAVSAELLGDGTAIALRKSDTALRNDLNRALEELMQNGEYQRILAPYHLDAS
jgi:ABC-type amino acid transport substrate-binding protein